MDRHILAFRWLLAIAWFENFLRETHNNCLIYIQYNYNQSNFHVALVAVALLL